MIQKKCFKCLSVKPLSEFYKHKSMADGHLNKCKSCTRTDVLDHRSKNLESIRAYDRERAKRPERIKAVREVVYNWRHEDKRRGAAHSAVARAMKSGRIVKRACERCGAEKAYAHHENYDRPLDVVWLCQADHKQRHKEMVLADIYP